MKLTRARSVLMLFVLLFAGVQQLSAQVIIARGVVMDRTSKIRVALAEITNLRTGFAVGSNDMGFYQLNAMPGDTLLIQKRNFEEAKVVVQNEKDVVVGLYPTVTNIAAITVSGQSKKSQLDEMRQDYKEKGVYHNGKPPVLAYIFNPISSIHSIFSRDAKNARRFEKFYTRELQQSSIDGLFNKTTVKKHTGLDGPELEKFMVEYRPDYEITKKWNTYDAVKYIQESYKKYLEKKK